MTKHLYIDPRSIFRGQFTLAVWAIGLVIIMLLLNAFTCSTSPAPASKTGLVTGLPWNTVARDIDVRKIQRSSSVNTLLVNYNIDGIPAELSTDRLVADDFLPATYQQDKYRVNNPRIGCEVNTQLAISLITSDQLEIVPMTAARLRSIKKNNNLQ